MVTESFTDDNVTTKMKKLSAMLLLVLALPATAQRTPTIGWSSWNTSSIDVDLNKGDNTVRL